MTQELAAIDPAMLALIRGSFDDRGLPLPFVREIFLLECEIAGTTFVDLRAVEPDLQLGATMILRREPDNKHDALAILILDQYGHKLGYVPRARNEVMARLIDAGKLIFGRLERKEWVGRWLRVGVRIFLRDL